MNKMKGILQFATACGLIAASIGSAQAQSDSSLDEVTVTAKRLEEEIPQQLAQYGTHVDVITAAQIKNGGYIDVASALEALAPALYVSSKNGPFDYVQVSLQGSRTEDVLWLVDGIRINNRLYAGTTPLDTIPASMIERIEVLDGGQALFYGTQAVAGAVNIVTKAFTDTPSGAFSVGADTNNSKLFSGYFRDAVGNNHFVVYASRDQSPGIQPFPDADYQPSGTDRHRYYYLTTLGGKYAYDFADHLTLSASYQHTEGKLDDAQPMLTALAYNRRDEDLVSSKLDYEPSDAFKVYVKDYIHYWRSHYTEVDNGTTAYTYTPGPPGATTVAENEGGWGYRDSGINLLTEFAPNRGLVYVAGYDYQDYTGRDAVLVIQQETEHVNAFFGQIRTTPDLIPDAHLAAGLRYNDPSFGQSATVWNGSGQYDLTHSVFLKASVGTAFRLPTDEELFANDPDDERGDPNLKPETSTFANVSVGGTAPLGESALKWEVIGFYRAIKNLIDFQSFDAATDQDVFGNVPGKVVVHGVEVTLQSLITQALSANFNATYSHSRQSGSDFQFDQVPVMQVKAGLDYHPSGLPVGASAMLVRVGDLDYEPFGAGNGRYGYGNYTLLDLSGRVFLDASRHQRIDLHLNNVFDKTYYTGLSFGVNDVSGNPYVAHDLGLPRTFSAYYTYSF
jgi:outer membrane cobalamin receptor